MINFKFNSSIFSTFKNAYWFNPNGSWKNKYKDNDPTKGPKFFGSTTFLVFTTDAWHFFQMIMLSCLSLIPLIPLTLYLKEINLEIINIVAINVLVFGIIKAIFGIIFEYFWSKVFIKK